MRRQCDVLLDALVHAAPACLPLGALVFDFSDVGAGCLHLLDLQLTLSHLLSELFNGLRKGQLRLCTTPTLARKSNAILRNGLLA